MRFSLIVVIAVVSILVSQSFLIPSYSDTVIATITVGPAPRGVAFDSTNDRMYVTNNNSNNVSVIDTASNTVIATIPVGIIPSGIAFDSVNDRMYVANSFGDDVSVISTASNTVIATIPVGDAPTGVAFDSTNDRMYVANQFDDNVSVISTASDTVIATILVGTSPFGIEFDSTNDRMYVANQGSGDVSVIDTASDNVIATIPVGGSLIAIAFDSTNNRMYVTNDFDDNVSVISTASDTVIATILVEDGPIGIAFDSANDRMYVTNSNSNNVSVISTTSNTVIDTIPVGASPFGIEFDSTNNRMYVGNSASTSVSVIELTPDATSSGKSNPFSGGYYTTPTIGLDRYGERIIDDGFSYNGNTVDVVDVHTPFPLISAQVGQTNTVTVKISENGSPSGIRLVQFGLGVPETDSPINNAEVIIEIWFEYGGDNIEEIKIIDKNNLIDNSSIDVSTKAVDCREGSTDQCTKITMKHKYREAPIYNIIRVEIMDGLRNLQATTFNDGVEVLGESMNPADTMNIIPVTLQNYPQKRGMIELTNIDRSEKLWTDPYGYVWQGDDSKMVLLSTIPPLPEDNDSKSVFFGYNNRINSNFAMYKETQSDLALGMMEAYYRTSINYEEPFLELNDIFSYEYPTPMDRVNDFLMQQEISKANTILEQLCPKCSDQSFVD